MNNELKVFSNTEFGELRLIEIEGKQYFPATYCARVLGYTNPHKAIIDHCKGATKREGVSKTVNQHGNVTHQTVEMNFIPEGDLYRLIIRSKLPAAGRFEKWVFDEVLPSIRQTGGYSDISEIVRSVVTETVSALMRELVPFLKEGAGTVINNQYNLKESPSKEIKLKNRGNKQSKIVKYGPKFMEEVTERIKGLETYTDIVADLRNRGYEISLSGLQRFAAARGLNVRDAFLK